MNLGHRIAIIERDDARRELALEQADNARLRRRLVELGDRDVLDLRDPERVTS